MTVPVLPMISSLKMLLRNKGIKTTLEVLHSIDRADEIVADSVHVVVSGSITKT